MSQVEESDQGLHCFLTTISIESAVKIKHLLENNKTWNELIQMITMDKFTVKKELNYKL